MVLQFDAYTIAVSIVVLILGYAAGRAAENLVLRLYEKTISRKARESGLEEVEEELGLEHGVRSLIANLLKYIIYTIAILIVLDLIGLTPISQILVEVVRYSPNIVGALLIVVFGIMIAEIAENITLIIVSDERFGNAFKDMQINLSGTAGLAVKYYVYLIALTMAVSQLGFAALTLNILIGVISFSIGVGAVVAGYLVAKDVVPNISAGHYIKNRGIIDEGDAVKIGEFKGKVVKIGSVFTTLKSRKKSCRIPNALLIKKIIEKEERADD